MIFLAVGGLARCSKTADKDSKAQSDNLGTATEQREEAITATKAAAQSAKDYAYAQKDEFIDAAK